MAERILPSESQRSEYTHTDIAKFLREAPTRFRNLLGKLFSGNQREKKPNAPELMTNEEREKIAKDIFDSITDQIKSYVGVDSTILPRNLVLTASRKNLTVENSTPVNQWVEVQRLTGLLDNVHNYDQNNHEHEGLIPSKAGTILMKLVPNNLGNIEMFVQQDYFRFKPKNDSVKQAALQVLDDYTLQKYGEKYLERYGDIGDTTIFADLRQASFQGFSFLINPDDWVPVQNSAYIEIFININGTVMRGIIVERLPPFPYHFYGTRPAYANAKYIMTSYITPVYEDEDEVAGIDRLSFILSAKYTTVVRLIPGSPSTKKVSDKPASQLVYQPILNPQAI